MDLFDVPVLRNVPSNAQELYLDRHSANSCLTGDTMKLLVTTSKSVLTVDTKTGRFEVRHSGKGLYYGIAYTKNDVFIAARCSCNCFDYLHAREHEQGEILVFDMAMNLVNTFLAPFPLRDMHHILFIDGKLWITCSFDNMVAIYDFNRWSRWYPSENIFERERDIHHFNSLYHDGNDLYLLAHNFGPSQIWRFSYPGLQLKETVSLGNQAHNIWRINSELHVCDSRNGLVVGDKGKHHFIGGFTRGSVVTDKRIYIGSSDVAEREQRQEVTSRIVVFDRKWHVLDEWVIRGHGQILDIRMPGSKDYCVPGMTGAKLSNHRWFSQMLPW